MQYADDGILYDLSPSLIQKLENGNTQMFKPESGIEIHPKKSRFIKKDNIWQHGLKFLGLMYIGPNILPAYLDQLPAKAQDEKLEHGLLVTSEGNSRPVARNAEGKITIGYGNPTVASLQAHLERRQKLSQTRKGLIQIPILADPGNLKVIDSQ